MQCLVPDTDIVELRDHSFMSYRIGSMDNKRGYAKSIVHDLRRDTSDEPRGLGRVLQYYGQVGSYVVGAWQ